MLRLPFTTSSKCYFVLSDVVVNCICHHTKTSCFGNLTRRPDCCDCRVVITSYSVDFTIQSSKTRRSTVTSSAVLGDTNGR